MSNKCIIVLDGVSDGKTRFVNLAKEHGLWTWNINARNVLSVASRSIGWSGIKDDHYYSFLTELMKLCNDYWGFKENYILQMIEKFKAHDKAQVLIVHDAGEVEVTLKAKQDMEQIYFVLIRTQTPMNEAFYDKVLDCTSPDFDQEVLKVLEALTK